MSCCLHLVSVVAAGGDQAAQPAEALHAAAAEGGCGDCPAAQEQEILLYAPMSEDQQKINTDLLQNTLMVRPRSHHQRQASSLG